MVLSDLTIVSLQENVHVNKTCLPGGNITFSMLHYTVYA